MARIPIYQERQQASQGLPVPEMRAPNVGAEAIGRSLQQVGQGLQTLAVGQLRLDTENGKAWAAKAGGEADLTWVQRFKQYQEVAKPGAANFTKTLIGDFDTYADDLLKTAPDEYSKKFLTEKLTSLRTNLARESLSFETIEGRNNRMFDVEDGINKSAQAVMLNSNPAFAESIIGQNDAIIDSMWLTPTKKREMKARNKETVASAYWSSLAQKDPNAVVNVFKSVGSGATASPDSVRNNTINFIMNDLEGSAYVADDAGAGPAKHGIVEKYNPGFNAKTGTKDQAAQIYRNIWADIKGDTLPPDLAVVMMDSAVNMGAGKARELLQKSGGDVQVFMKLRQNHYDALVRDNPTQYGQYEEGWKNRQTKLQNFLDSGKFAGAGSTGNPLIDSLPISKQLSIMKMAQDNATVANTELVANQVWTDFGPKSDASAINEDVMREQVDVLMANRPLAERKVAYDILSNRTQAFNRSVNQRQAADVSGVWEMALSGRTYDEIIQSDTFKALPGDRKVTLMGQLQTFQNKGETLEQEARYLDLTSDPQKLAAMTNEQVIALAPMLGTKLTKDLMRKRADLNNPEKIAAATIDNEDFNMLADQAGLKPFNTEKSDEEKAALGQLKYAVEQRILAEQIDKKRVLTREERVKAMQQELDNKVMIDITIWKDEQKPISLVSKDDLEKTYVVVDGKEVRLNSIPASSRAMIVRQLRANNRPVTEQAIAELFVRARSQKTYGTPVPSVGAK